MRVPAIHPDSQTLSKPRMLHTTSGAHPLHEYHLQLAGREWVILHTGLILTHADEQQFFREQLGRLPYGVALWPASIALAHELVARCEPIAGKTVLELGSGTGLPGIVAASLGARAVQTDRHDLALEICRRNAEQNRIGMIEQRRADWTDWSDAHRYDWIIGSDVLYSEKMHPYLRQIFRGNLAPGGRLLLSDPLRAASIRLLEALQDEGWTVAMAKWNLDDGNQKRTFGVFELTPPQDTR